MAATPGEAGGPARRSASWALLAPVLVSLVLLVVAGFRLDAPYGPDFDGFNTAVWAEGSRAARTDGWFGTRLGAATPQLEAAGQPPYAHHPPLLRVEIAAAQTWLGEGRWVARLPALLSSLAAVWLCWGWLGAMGLRNSARALGVLALGGTSMFLLYGLMLNMEAVWLPFAFGLLWLWQTGERRSAEGSAGPGTGIACGAVALVGSLAAHQGILLAALLAAVGVVRSLRNRRRLATHEVGVVVATALGAALFLGWILWAVGSLSDLVRIARVRADGRGSWASWAERQLAHARATIRMFGIAALLAGPMLARRRPEVAVPLAVTWAVAVTYAVLFRQGAAIHPYWNVALLPPLAVGAALVAERCESISRRVLGVILVIGALTVVSTAVTTVRVGAVSDGTGELARVAGESTESLHTTDLAASWIRYEAGRNEIGEVSTCGEVRDLADRDRSAQVLTQRTWPPLAGTGWDAAISAPSARRNQASLLIRADELAAICR